MKKNIKKSIAGKKILVVDDDPHILRSIFLVLDREGYRVITAADGAEGLKKAKEEAPHLIILDLMLPKLNGFEVYKQLKADVRTRKIRTIVLTAKGEKEDKKMGKELGVEAYITKPFDINTLLLKTEKVLTAG